MITHMITTVALVADFQGYISRLCTETNSSGFRNDHKGKDGQQQVGIRGQASSLGLYLLRKVYIFVLETQNFKKRPKDKHR